MTRTLWLRSLCSALAAGAVLAGCGAGAKSSTTSTHTHAVAPTGTGGSEQEQVKQRKAGAKPLTLEEMTEYDANEGRCHDDHGSVRDVGTVNAYCAFPARSNDFHLIESSSKQTEVSEEE